MAKKTGKHTPEQIEQFWALLAEGWSYKEIERKTGISRWTLTDLRWFRVQVRINQRLAHKYGFYGEVA